MEEQWKSVRGYEGKYIVSDRGRVLSLPSVTRPEVYEMKVRYPYGRAYKSVELIDKNGKKHNPRVHRLVAEAFIPNPDNKEQVNHKDGNPGNNCVDNLEWVTPSENTQHAYDTGLAKAYGHDKKPVVMIDDFGCEVKRFDSVAEAAIEIERSKSSITYAIKHGCRSGGYYWKVDGDVAWKLPGNKNVAKRVPVVSVDSNGNAMVWESIHKAQLELGVPRGNILACLKGKLQHAGGYKWYSAKQNDKGYPVYDAFVKVVE